MAMGTPCFVARHARAWQSGCAWDGSDVVVPWPSDRGSLVVLDLLTVAEETMSLKMSFSCASPVQKT